MSKLLKAVLQNIIKDRSELAEASLHAYIVDKTRQLNEKLTTPRKPERLGWCVVRELDDALCLGPYKTYEQASTAMKNRDLRTYGVSANKVVYVEHGWVDDEDKFHELKSE